MRIASFNSGCCFRICAGIVLIALCSASAMASSQVLVRDITEIEGVRDNPLVGYGLVIGLHGTGDRQQTFFTVQTLANAMQRMGVQIAPSQVRVANVAAVFVTASLPPFSRQGTRLDVTVSSVGDAKSLEGGILLLTSLRGPDGQVYAGAQGPLTLGGYSAGGGAGNAKTVNHSTVGRVPEGAIVERDVAVDLSKMKTVSLLLRDPDFTAARDIADAINNAFQKEIAAALDSRRVDVDVARSGAASVPILISRVQNLGITFHPPAKVVVNERTGTIVMGGDVKLSAVSILHGNLSIQVETSYRVSQPNALGTGQTVTVPETKLNVTEAPARSIKLEQGASVEELINGLHALGATARDVVAILQAIKAAGGLQADLEIM